MSMLYTYMYMSMSQADELGSIHGIQFVSSGTKLEVILHQMWDSYSIIVRPSMRMIPRWVVRDTTWGSSLRHDGSSWCYRHHQQAMRRKWRKARTNVPLIQSFIYSFFNKISSPYANSIYNFIAAINTNLIYCCWQILNIFMMLWML